MGTYRFMSVCAGVLVDLMCAYENVISISFHTQV
jgi:hypothetical protein